MPKPKYTPDDLLRDEEVAAFFNVSVRAVECWALKKRLPVYKLGWRSRRFRFCDVQKFLNDSLIPPRPEENKRIKEGVPG